MQCLTSRAVQTDITWPQGQDLPTEVSTTSASTQTVSDASKPNTVSQQHECNGFSVGKAQRRQETEEREEQQIYFSLEKSICLS